MEEERMEEERVEMNEEEEETQEVNGYLACRHCGKLMPSTACYCHACGRELGAADAAVWGTGIYGTESGSGVASPPGAVAPPPGPPPPCPSPYPYRPGSPYWPAYPCQPPYRPRRMDEAAVISLVCALASFVILPFFPAVAAIALGFVSRQRIREGGGSLEGAGLALAGIIVGVINVALCLGVFMLLVVLVARP
ncbi:MAG: DUF4190 domain-containing protein [Actinomycetota bacterium]|nr:DUF4190 domain-containing protein [Actinomycetota bacterium]